MLKIIFINDGTGDEIEGNYKWMVELNDKMLAHGNLKGHNRLTGWKGLIKHFVKQLNKKRKQNETQK